MRKILIGVLLLAVSCVSRTERTDTLPEIAPDYIGVTVPVNIAPLHFGMADGSDIQVVWRAGDYKVTSDGDISPRAWKKLCSRACGDAITLTVTSVQKGRRVEYASFEIFVSEDRIDPYLAYRLIEPGYELWNEMGIYQRCLENFDETPILTNKMTGYGCMNCHSFCGYDPDRMLFHLRVDYGGTYVVQNGDIEKLNTKTPETISALVYPQWHPSGRFVAFSTNSTKQHFHTTDPNRVEVFDLASDVVVYDVGKHEIVSSPMLKSETAFETFPTFSPDGKTLFFCSADSTAMPENFEKVRYSLCSISFDPDTRTFGETVDTLYNARLMGRSVSFPRVSPDGIFLMFTLSAYGNFSIWHKDADLYMADLCSGTVTPLQTLNSDDVESYHSWSSSGRWVVFSSRRLDKLYTRPFIAHIDADGKASKPFLLPQKDAGYYSSLMKSFNVPEFVSGKVKVSQYELSQVAKTQKGTDIKYIK